MLSIVQHALILATCSVVLWKTAPWDILFKWHPSLMAIAFLAFIPEAILVFSKNGASLVPKNWSHSNKILSHFVLMTVGYFAMVGGGAAIYINKDRIEKPHFTSYHGQFGLLTMGAFTMTWLFGLVLLFGMYYPDRIRVLTKPLGGIRKVYRVHGVAATLFYSVGIFTLVLGFYSGYWENQLQGLPWGLHTVATVVVGLIIVLQTTKTF
eukprot:m.44127 g.44127  ORF g.44127 m.44127 type:complete len:209 (+) comp19587_c0_seq1:229-855(+)